MAPQQLQTDNFVVHFDEQAVPNSTARAQDLLAHCEQEFAVLTSWFGIKNAFGQHDQIQVYLDQADSTGAVNYGYQSNGGSNMHLDAQSANNNGANAVAIVKTLFVAELVEIFMDYNNQKSGKKTWLAKDSNGEGLSQLCSIERAREGHYLYYGSWVDWWLQPPNTLTLPSGSLSSQPPSTRPNVIDKADPTDGNYWSFGGALLFLYYLRTQLGHGMAPIIQKGGATLEETYQNLTGNGGAFQTFQQLINRFFPTGNAPKFKTFDDPFPLLDSGARSAGIWMADTPIGQPEVARKGKANVRPFFTCPVKTYDFEIDNTHTQLVCTSLTRGFGQMSFSWRVNGVDIPASGVVPVSATVTDVDPTAGGRSTQTINLNCTVSATPWQGVLTVDLPAAAVGWIDFTIELQVADKVDSPAAVIPATDRITVANETVVWKEPYYEDGNRCRSAFNRKMLPFTKVKNINILLTLPDPPHYYDRVIHDIAAIPEALAALDKVAPDEAHKLRVAIEEITGLSTEMIDEIATQLRPQGAGS